VDLQAKQPELKKNSKRNNLLNRLMPVFTGIFFVQSIDS